MTDDELVKLGKHSESSLPPWGIGTTRSDYLRACRAVISANQDNLLELIDNFAEVRHTCGHWTYNLKSNEARQKVIAALKGEG